LLASSSGNPSSPDKLQSAQSCIHSEASCPSKKKNEKKNSCLFSFFSAADFFGFFFHAIPELHEGEGSAASAVLTLSELHDLIANVWLTRHDAELEAEREARRKGRPKSTKEQKLEETKLREAEEYRTGMGEFAILLSLRRFSPRGFSPLHRVKLTGIINYGTNANGFAASRSHDVIYFRGTGSNTP
jgi:Translation machinery-associated protein 16